jgi:hypothetical protein
LHGVVFANFCRVDWHSCRAIVEMAAKAARCERQRSDSLRLIDIDWRRRVVRCFELNVTFSNEEGDIPLLNLREKDRASLAIIFSWLSSRRAQEFQIGRSST